MRILVFADDLTGAAEIAAIGWRFGLRAHLHRDMAAPHSPAELIVVDSDSRSLSSDDAALKLRQLAKAYRGNDFDLIYKKTDSVLRGPVMAELDALRQSLGRRRVLLAPQNPHHGRTIRNGRYYIDDLPLDKSTFANDPEWPAQSALVMDRLGNPAGAIVADADHGEPSTHIHTVVCNGQSTEALCAWARQVTADTLPAGGAAFFTACLASHGRVAHAPDDPAAPMDWQLMVCGSGSDYSRGILWQDADPKIQRCLMPDALFRRPDDDSAIDRWRHEIVAALAGGDHVMIGIPQAIDASEARPRRLVNCLARVVQGIWADIRLSHVLIEGGATASGICRVMGWSRLTVEAELAPGTVRLAVVGEVGPWITIKPGSYAWPGAVLQQGLVGDET